MHPRLFLVVAVSCALLQGCTPGRQEKAPLLSSWRVQIERALPPGCHVPQDGKPTELTERGIGGTGGTAPPPQPPGPIRPSLGVAGIIDGFGSVCVNGLEVSLLPESTITRDGTPASVADLRIGQQAVLTAMWADGRPVTNRLLIRHAVVGPIEKMTGRRIAVVAGQTVLLSAAWIDATPRVGQWVAISGLRTPSGDILASRVDRAAGPSVLVHGRLEGTGNEPRMGNLSVPSSLATMPIGSEVILHGVDDHGVVRVTRLQSDLLAGNPRALFGREVRHFLIQTLIGPGQHPLASLDKPVALPPGVVLPYSNQPAVVNVNVGVNGTFTVQAASLGIGGWPRSQNNSAPSPPPGPSPARNGMNAGHGAPGSPSAPQRSASHF